MGIFVLILGFRALVLLEIHRLQVFLYENLPFPLKLVDPLEQLCD